MGLADWVGFAFVFVVVVAIELWLLFDRTLSEGLASEIGVSPLVFALLCWLAAAVIIGVVYEAAKRGNREP
ncbi:MAG: hypothetical protein L3J68_00230 [Thermoplasmata archaeon]|nr:hypothetical protein [Thermoplasmata archaeon]